MTIDYQALRDAAEAIKIAATPQKLLAFRMKVTPQCHERCNSDPHPTPEIRSRG